MYCAQIFFSSRCIFLIVFNHVDDWWLLCSCHMLTYWFLEYGEVSLPLLPHSLRTPEILLLSHAKRPYNQLDEMTASSPSMLYPPSFVFFPTFGSFSPSYPSLFASLENTVFWVLDEAFLSLENPPCQVPHSFFVLPLVISIHIT